MVIYTPLCRFEGPHVHRNMNLDQIDKNQQYIVSDSYRNSDSEYLFRWKSFSAGLKCLTTRYWFINFFNCLETVGKRSEYKLILDIKRFISSALIGKVIPLLQIEDLFQDHEFTIVSEFVVPVIFGFDSLD